MTAYTNNFGLSLQGLNENNNTWGLAGTAPYPGNPGPGLNSGVFVPLDAVLGGTNTIAISNGNNSISFQTWLNHIFVLTGTLTADATVIIPLSPNSVGSATAVGGEFIVVNNTTGAFNVTVKTAATGSLGVVVPQSRVSVSDANNYVASELYSDGVNVRYADKGSAAFVQAVNGNPNGQLPGIAGSVNTNAQLAYDYTNGVLYVCGATGIATGAGQAVWVNPVASGQPIPQPEGYLTMQSNTPIITGDITGGSAVVLYYTPFYGAWTAINNGTGVVPYKFSQQMALVLSSAQSANQAYDIFMIYSGGTPGVGTPVIASGSAWSSAAAGSSSRGSASAIGRDIASGLYLNAQIQSMTYNNGSISGVTSVPLGGGVYLGSIQVDAASGQVSCYRSYGNNPVRKFGVWNCFNRSPIKTIAGDAAGAGNGGVSFVQFNNNAFNQISVFTGLQEEIATCEFFSSCTVSPSASGRLGIGLNSISVASGVSTAAANGTGSGSITGTVSAKFVTLPLFGANNIVMLQAGGVNNFFGTTGGVIGNLLSVEYRG